METATRWSMSHCLLFSVVVPGSDQARVRCFVSNTSHCISLLWNSPVVQILEIVSVDTSAVRQSRQLCGASNEAHR
jgi:hypothetical protein